MRIINLLEGSEKLFHLTNFYNFVKIVKARSLLCNSIHGREFTAVRDKLGITGQIFYLSMARSLTSSFIMNMSRGDKTSIIFEIDGRKLSRYGRVVPFNFFSSDRYSPDEMEDRLVGNRGEISLTSGVITGIMVLNAAPTPEQYRVFKEANSLGIPMRFFSSPADLRGGRKFKTFEEMYAGAQDDEHEQFERIELWARDIGPKFLQDFISYLDGEMPKNKREFLDGCDMLYSEFEYVIRDIMEFDYHIVRKLLMKLRRIGVGPNQRSDFMLKIIENIHEDKHFSIDIIDELNH